MLIITSPSKTFDVTTDFPDVKSTLPELIEYSHQIHKVLYKKTALDLEKTLDVGPKIAEECFLRIHAWATDHNIVNSRPAIFAFTGDIYDELHPKKYNFKEQKYAQKSLRIISGFYGVLRPYDLIQPHRLDMHTNIKLQRNKDLYQFWGPVISEYIEGDCEDKNFILDLATEEYEKAIDLKSSDCPVIRAEFKQQQNGKLASYGPLIKKARGMMIEFCIKNQITTRDQLKKFNTAGYKFVQEDKHGTLSFIQTN